MKINLNTGSLYRQSDLILEVNYGRRSGSNNGK